MQYVRHTSTAHAVFNGYGLPIYRLSIFLAGKHLVWSTETKTQIATPVPTTDYLVSLPPTLTLLLIFLYPCLVYQGVLSIMNYVSFKGIHVLLKTEHV